MMGEADTAIVVVAGGSGKRFGRSGGKQLADLCGRPLLAHTLEACCAAPGVTFVVIVAPAERIGEYRAAVSDVDTCEVDVGFAPGGARRQDSVAAGIAAVPESIGYIAVHDGARPLVSAQAFAQARVLLDSDTRLDGVVVGHRVFDTLKRVEHGRIIDTPDRTLYWVAQTPQLFRARALRSAYEEAEETARERTDDSSLVEAVGGLVGVVEGARDNIKVTVESDLALARAVLGARCVEEHE